MSSKRKTPSVAIASEENNSALRSYSLQDGFLAVVGFDKDSYSLPNVLHAAVPPALGSCSLPDRYLAVVESEKGSYFLSDYERCAVPPDLGSCCLQAALIVYEHNFLVF